MGLGLGAGAGLWLGLGGGGWGWAGAGAAGRGAGAGGLAGFFEVGEFCDWKLISIWLGGKGVGRGQEFFDWNLIF